MNYQLDENGNPEIMYCVQCQIKLNEKVIALFIYNGDSLCEKHFNYIIPIVKK